MTGLMRGHRIYTFTIICRIKSLIANHWKEAGSDVLDSVYLSVGKILQEP